MGCTVREKYIRVNRRARPAKPPSDQKSKLSINELGTPRLSNCHLGCDESGQHPIPDFDSSNWGYCTEEQLEEIVVTNLEVLYNEAINKLVDLGYDEGVAMKAILRNGHCYGAMDVLSNILDNTLTYLNGRSNANSEESGPVFVDVRQLVEYSLACMVHLLQQVKPHLSRGDAMWCLLMCDLHAARACLMKIPALASPGDGNNGCSSSVLSNAENVVDTLPVGIAPAFCTFHGFRSLENDGASEFPMSGFVPCASEMTLQREIELPKRFNLTPSMKNLLKRNVAAFAAGFRANSKELQTQGCSSSLSNEDSSAGVATRVEVPVEQNEEQHNSKNQEVVNSMLSRFRDLNLDENAECVAADQKDEMIFGLIHQIKDLERQVKERKEWAHQKAMQAARKLSHDLLELKTLRMEREETQQLKNWKQTLEDTTMKRLSDMENSLRKASGQVDRANAAVRRLETENAEIRAEMEASKLSASESVKTCLEVAKREKKSLKRLLAWEKQKTKLQEDIAAEKQNIAELHAQLVRIEAAQKEAEAKWRQEQKAKELALAQVVEERRLKETTEASNKRGQEALCLKMEIDFQRYKDDLQRLEQELSRLKVSTQATELNHQSNNSPEGNAKGTKLQGETIVSMLHELNSPEDSSERVVCDRECLICMQDEVSVVFLPCAHQVLCAKCNDNYGKKGKAICPCCQVPIEQRIRVFGAS